MSEFRNTPPLSRLPTGIAVVVLSALLLGSQLAETAHAEIDCEHESCSVCIGAGTDPALVGDPEFLTGLRYELRVNTPDPTVLYSTLQSLARSIRGPPAC